MNYETFKLTEAVDPTPESIRYLVDRIRNSATFKSDKLKINFAKDFIRKSYLSGAFDYLKIDFGCVLWIIFDYESKGEKDFIYWQDGATIMAQILGFRSTFKLQMWAQNNKEIWGNEYGSGMFALTSAYFCDDRNISLSKICLHLDEVASRLPQ